MISRIPGFNPLREKTTSMHAAYAMNSSFCPGSGASPVRPLHSMNQRGQDGRIHLNERSTLG